MKLLLQTALLLCGAALWCAPQTWQFDFPDEEADKAFWSEFRQKVVGAGNEPAVDFDVNMTIESKEPHSGYTFCKVAYNVEKDERVKAYLLIPDHQPGERLPLMFCLHPTGRGGKDIMLNLYRSPARDAKEELRRVNRANALELVRRGYVCFLPDRYGFGERAPKPEDPDAIRNLRLAEAQFAERHPGWHKAFGKVPYDLSRALDGLLKFDFIDPENIGTEGHSLGGWDSLYFWGTDPRVKAAVVNSGGAHCFFRELWLDPKWRTGFLEGRQGPKPNTDGCAQIFIMYGAPKALLYMRSHKDDGTDYTQTPVNNARMIREYFVKRGGKGKFACFTHDEGHDFPVYARALAWSWLDVGLKKATYSPSTTNKEKGRGR